MFIVRIYRHEYWALIAAMLRRGALISAEGRGDFSPRDFTLRFLVMLRFCAAEFTPAWRSSHKCRAYATRHFSFIFIYLFIIFARRDNFYLLPCRSMSDATAGREFPAACY